MVAGRTLDAADLVADFLGRRVEGLSVAHNWAGRSHPDGHGQMAMPRLFRWRGPEGGEVVVWRTDTPHGVIHAELRAACGGPPSAVAGADELQQRIDHIRHWAITRKKGA